MEYILQLGLNKSNDSNALHEGLVRIVWLIDQILDLVAENASDSDQNQDSQFRSQLERPRNEILNTVGSRVQESLASRTLDLCRKQFENVRRSRAEREERIAEIILFLRQSLAGLAGDSRRFHEDLIGTTDRIRGLTQLKDMQELKSRVVAEVDELTRVVQEKQKRDELQHEQFSKQIAVLQNKLEKARTEASLDGLTGIANRRTFDFVIQRWVSAHQESEEPFTIAFLDLDDFKQVNDEFGHQIGDQLLAQLAQRLGKSIRSSDFLARYGGEEFVVLSAGTKLDQSEKRFSDILRVIEKTTFTCKSEEKGDLEFRITVSCGVAEYALHEPAKDLVRRADEALYEAKRAGKNRVASKKRPLLGAYYEGRKRKPAI